MVAIYKVCHKSCTIGVIQIYKVFKLKMGTRCRITIHVRYGGLPEKCCAEAFFSMTLDSLLTLLEWWTHMH